MLYVLIVLAVLPLKVVATLVYLHAVEWVMDRY